MPLPRWVQLPGGVVNRPTIRLMTVAPGHFHAALVQKRMHPSVHRRTYVYAPLDDDLVAHLDRISGFNSRTDQPTDWDLDLRCGNDYLARFLREQPGNTVVLSGRNRPKIDLMLAAVRNNLHVLADKPWIVEAADRPKLEELLREAEAREVLVSDVMTERHEVTTRLQRELIRDHEIFGDWLAGSREHPGLAFESVHYLKKTVAGRPLKRPWWWFDPSISGDALADVGTHLVDLAMWFVALDQGIDHEIDIELLDADRWPLILDPQQFATLTGLAEYPEELKPRTVGDLLYYAGNNSASFSLRGVHVQIKTCWEYEATIGGDTHHAMARGSRAAVEIRQQPGGEPELSVTPTDPSDQPRMLAALLRKCHDWEWDYPGVTIGEKDGRFEIVIPAALRTGHESHFAAVLDEFVHYFHSPRTVPTWERTNVFTKYFITTKAVELARERRRF
jgi:predicted dehydrogenase